MLVAERLEDRNLAADLARVRARAGELVRDGRVRGNALDCVERAVRIDGLDDDSEAP